MDVINFILQGISTATTLSNILFALLGAVIGTLVGVLPGLGSIAAISILLPYTFFIKDPSSAIIFTCAIYYGTQYGGSTSAILLNLPGESSSAVTCIEGYKLSKKGRGGAALTIAAISSFFAGTVSIFFIIFASIPLANFGLKFGAVEYVALMLGGLFLSTIFSSSDILKNMAMCCLGILLSLIGTDINSGVRRFSMGIPNLYDGLSLVAIFMGIFGLAEVFYNLYLGGMNNVKKNIKIDLFPSKKEIKDSICPTIRGTLLGSIVGVIPGAGAVLSSFFSYFIEKIINKKNNKFGKGHMAGVAGPEAANNASVQTGLIPTLILGIPTTPATALLIGVLMIHSIQPGPSVIDTNAGLFWALIVSMWIGNFFLLILNLPLVGLWVQLLKIKKSLLYPVIVIVSILGSYFVNGSMFDVYLLFLFAIIGFIFKILDCSPIALSMGFVLGVILEENIIRMLTINQGDWNVLFKSPIFFAIFIFIFIIIFYNIIKKFSK